MKYAVCSLALLMASGCGQGALGAQAPKMPMQCSLVGTQDDLYIFDCQAQGIDNFVYVNADGKTDHVEFQRPGT